MRVDIAKLKGKIVEHGKTQGKIAECLGMNRDTFGRRMKHNGVTFALEDVFQMAGDIPLTLEEVIEIFLAEDIEDATRKVRGNTHGTVEKA